MLGEFSTIHGPLYIGRYCLSIGKCIRYRQHNCVNSKKGFLSQELFRCEMTP